MKFFTVYLASEIEKTSSVEVQAESAEFTGTLLQLVSKGNVVAQFVSSKVLGWVENQ